MFAELRELLRSGAIRRHQLGAKYLLTPTASDRGKGVGKLAEQKKEQAVDTKQLLKVRREKLAELQANGQNPFEITKYDVTSHSAEIKDNFEKLESQSVRIAGRMMSKRVMGKASFCNVQDLQGGIQCYVARDSVGEEEYKAFKKLDIGDIIGIEGVVFKTKTGEISIHAEKLVLLSKSLQILPEKYHGLTNTDTRYRQRYVGSDYESGSKGHFCKAFPDHQHDPQISGWSGLHGGRDSDARSKCGRGGGASV